MEREKTFWLLRIALKLSIEDMLILIQINLEILHQKKAQEHQRVEEENDRINALYVFYTHKFYQQLLSIFLAAVDTELTSLLLVSCLLFAFSFFSFYLTFAFAHRNLAFIFINFNFHRRALLLIWYCCASSI